MARSQQPVTVLVRDLVAEAAGAGAIRTDDVDGATYMILALKSALSTSRVLVSGQTSISRVRGSTS